MKLKAIILGIIVAVLLTACYPLVSPMQPRTNPADSKNLVPLAMDFSASYNTGSGNVDLAWSPIPVDNSDGEERHRDGYVIIRKTGSPPTSVYDGIMVSDPFGSEDNAFADGVDLNPSDDNVQGAQGGYVNFYGLFAFWNEDGDSEGLGHNEAGIIQYTEGFVFSGPLVADIALTTITLPVAEDIYVTNAYQTFDDDFLTIAVDAADNPTSVACVRFNVEAIQGATISSARLVLKNADSFMNANYSAKANRIISGWSGSVSWDTVMDSVNFFSTAEEFEINETNTNTEDTNSTENDTLKTMVQDWADGSGNNGFRIMMDSMMAATYNFSFYSSNQNSGADGPKLVVEYSFE